MPKIYNNIIKKTVFATVLVHFLAISQLNAAPVKIESALSLSKSSTQYSSEEKVDNCSAYFEGTSHIGSCRDGEVPAPAATWLFFLALVTFVGISSKRKL